MDYKLVLPEAIFYLPLLQTRKYLSLSTEWLEAFLIFISSPDQLPRTSLSSMEHWLDFRRGSQRGASGFIFAGLGVRFWPYFFLWRIQMSDGATKTSARRRNKWRVCEKLIFRLKVRTTYLMYICHWILRVAMSSHVERYWSISFISRLYDRS
jgi:hypothetical protein